MCLIKIMFNVVINYLINKLPYGFIYQRSQLHVRLDDGQSEYAFVIQRYQNWYELRHFPFLIYKTFTR